jgi:hypothetical protein
MNSRAPLPPPGEAANLLRREPRAGFRQGAHLRLAELADGGVTRFFSSEAAPVYLTLLYALLLFRRRHELDPLHSVLYDEARPVVQNQAGVPYSLDSYAADVNQLVEWGCLKREVEAARIRGYRDRSREHFRYTLTADTVSFLEWLEGRLDQRVHGTSQDGRDLLLDLTQRLNEAAKIVRRLREGGDDEDARRLIYLLESADGEMDAIGRDLTVLRAEMHAYARGLASAEDLRRVVEGLERYVARYVRRLRELGGRAYVAARRLTRKTALDVLRQAQEKMASDGVGGRSVRRDGGELLQNAIVPFLRPNGRLFDTCSRVEEMAAQVVQRIHRQLRDLELRNFRLEEIGSRLQEMAALGDDDGRPGVFLRRLTAFAHVPNDPNLESEGKARLPMVRAFREWTDRGAPEPLRRPSVRPEDVLVHEEDRRARLRAYVHHTLLRGAWSGRLSQSRLVSGENPFDWLAVAKAGFLSQGRDLDRAGVHVQDEPGEALLSSDGRHLSTVDHTLMVRRDPSGS